MWPGQAPLALVSDALLTALRGPELNTYILSYEDELMCETILILPRYMGSAKLRGNILV